MCRTTSRPGRLRLGIELEPREDVFDDAHVVLRLLEVLLPFLLEVVVHGAAERRLVDLHAAELGLEGLVEQLVDFFVLHEPLLHAIAHPGGVLGHAAGGCARSVDRASTPMRAPGCRMRTPSRIRLDPSTRRDVATTVLRGVGLAPESIAVFMFLESCWQMMCQSARRSDVALTRELPRNSRAGMTSPARCDRWTVHRSTLALRDGRTYRHRWHASDSLTDSHRPAATRPIHRSYTVCDGALRQFDAAVGLELQGSVNFLECRSHSRSRGARCGAWRTRADFGMMPCTHDDAEHGAPAGSCTRGPRNQDGAARSQGGKQQWHLES